MTERERFAADYGIDVDRVGKMARYAAEAKYHNEKACNGDPHPLNRNPEDKNRNSELWAHRVEIDANELLRLAQQYGFDSVEFTGLRPCLKKAGRFVEIPS